MKRALGLVALAVLGLGACSDTPASPVGTTVKDVGWARVAYPDGWTVLPENDRPKGWSWAAQPASAATTQIAVDGEFSQWRDVGMSSASLLAGAQVGALPGFAVVDQGPIDVHGAAEAVRIRFTYTVKGTVYEGVWLVARAKDARTVAVQVTGRRPLSDQLTDQTLAGLSLLKASGDQGDDGTQEHA